MSEQTNSSQETNKLLFLNLITSLSMSALQAMGKIINPLSGKTETSLNGAQATIDMLDMLESKTHGNRDAAEEKLLKDTLMMLKMNYVEAKAGAGAPTAEKTEPAQPDQTPTAEREVERPQAQQPISKEPKFRKSYS